MRIARIAVGCGLLVVGMAAQPSDAGDGPIVFEDCTGLELSLEGAPHHYWIASEKGRVVLVRQCVAAEADCDHDVITVWDGDGRKIFEAAPFLDIPEMADGSILDAALRTPDRLVVSAVVGNTGDFRPVLAEYDIGTGELVRVVPTGPVLCLDVAGDASGVTWCLGRDTVRDPAGRNFDLVYRFNAAGEFERASLPRSAFHPMSEPLRSSLGRGSLRGGFLPGDGAPRLWLPAVDELISFDAEGAVADRLELPAIEGQQRAHLVSSPDGAVYAMLVTGEENEPGEWTQALYRLAGDGSAWKALENAAIQFPLRIALVGAEEQGLVLVDQRSLVLCRLPVAGEVGSEE